MLVTGAPGVLRDINDPASRIPRLTVAEGKRAIADGVVSGGMIPKLEESFAALALGARAIYIVAGERRPRGARARRRRHRPRPVASYSFAPLIS